MQGTVNLKLIASMVCREFGQHNHKLLFEGVPTKEDLPCCHNTRKRFWMLWKKCNQCSGKGKDIHCRCAYAPCLHSNLPCAGCDGSGYVLIEDDLLEGVVRAADQEGISVSQTADSLIFRRENMTLLHVQQGRWSLYEGLGSALVELLND